jgi:phage terminase large subunit-like protein
MPSDPHYRQIAEAYASGVVKGKIIAGPYTRMACRRHLEDLKRSKTKRFPYRFNDRKAQSVCGFLSDLPHIKGRWAGSLIKLEPWQVFNLASIFGWVRKSDDLRRFTHAYLEVARKNAKSTIGAGTGLYMLTEDGEPGAEVYSGATNEKQALEVFTPARLMAKKADGFADHYGLKIAKQSLYVEDSAAKFLPLVGNPGDGSSPHCAIVDEYHEHPTSVLYDAMDTGMGARDQPLLLVITTAGINIAGPCYEQRDHVIKTLDGTFENDRLFGNIYTLDEDDDWADFKVWVKANPNIGVSAYEDYLKSRLLTAKQRVSQQNIIRCKHLNQWMNASTAWMDPLKWKRCGVPDLSIEDYIGRECIIALDIATKIDITAKAYLFFEDDGNYTLFFRYYIPEETAALPHNSHYQGWIKQGWLTTTSGDVLDFELIREQLNEDTRRFQVGQIAYDPWQATQLATQLQGDGAPMLEFPQQVRTMSEPMKELQALIYSTRIRHQGDPVTAWMMSNVVAKVDAKENVFPRKEFDKNKIDGPVSAIMAVAVAIQRNTYFLTGYENGIQFI